MPRRVVAVSCGDISALPLYDPAVSPERCTNASYGTKASGMNGHSPVPVGRSSIASSASTMAVTSTPITVSSVTSPRL